MTAKTKTYMRPLTAMETVKVKLDNGKRITLKDIISAILLLDHRTDFANGALGNMWRGLINKYGNALKDSPKKTIAYTLTLAYLAHPYVIDIASDFMNHHKDSPLLAKAVSALVKAFGV